MVRQNIRSRLSYIPFVHQGGFRMSNLVHRAVEAIATLLRQNPNVHCITNTVAQNFTANVLLACGVKPSMSVALAEITDFTTRCDALLINLGTMDPERSKAARWAVQVAARHAIPFALDPVFAQASSVRLALARQLILCEPAIIRANSSEAAALFGNTEIDEIARLQQGCIVISGESDLVSDGRNSVKITNGAPIMTQITAMGCALTALMAALMAVEDDPFVASVAALLWFNIAGEIAAEISSGPGTFVALFIDALANIDGNTIAKMARIS